MDHRVISNESVKYEPLSAQLQTQVEESQRRCLIQEKEIKRLEQLNLFLETERYVQKLNK